MNSTIWKFEIEPHTDSVLMPHGAKLIHAAAQGSKVCVWAECDPSAEIVRRRLTPVVTGGTFPAHAAYVGTAHPREGGKTYVVHVYDRGEA